MVDRPIEIVLTTLLLLQIWLVWLVILRIRSARSAGAKRAGLALVAIYSCVLLLGFSFNLGRVRVRSPLPVWFSQNLREYTTLWLGCSGVGAVLWFGVGRLFPEQRSREDVDPGRRQLLRAAQTVAAAAPFAVVGYGTFIERRSFRVTEVELSVPNLPRDLEGLRMAQISDIHLSPTVSVSDLRWVVDATNELRPHLSFVTGDLITKHSDPVDACLDELARLRADSGVYGSMGNHETYARVERHVFDRGRRLGIEFLRYESRLLRFGSATLNLTGVDYEPLDRADRYLAGCERLLRPDAVNVLLSHNPDVIPTAVRKGFDVTLAGHTHGGQVTLEFLHPAANIARYYTPYVYGKYELTQGGRFGTAFVTRGIGTIAVPVRLGAPPEVALVKLRRRPSPSPIRT